MFHLTIANWILWILLKQVSGVEQLIGEFYIFFHNDYKEFSLFEMICINKDVV